MLEVTIKNLPERRVAFLRHVGSYDKCGPTWERLLTEMGSQGWLGGDNLMLGICHDDPENTDAEKIRYDACVTVGDSFKPFAGIEQTTVAGGAYAVVTHIGPYSELGGTYAELFGSWLAQSGRELRNAPAYEIYLSDPDNTEPEELITEIHMPLEETN